MAKPGRDLELLVARLERFFDSDRSVTIESPMIVTGSTSGVSREVDVGVRRRVGSVETIVAFECRDRSRLQDIEWIDSLAGKREELGFPHVVGVSSRGFSEAARSSAGRRGIVLRSVEAIEQTELLEWFGGPFVVVADIPTIEVVDAVTIDVDGQELDPEWVSACELPGASRAPLFTAKPTGTQRSVADLCEHLIPSDAYAGIPADAGLHPMIIKLDFPDPNNCFQVPGLDGMLDVRSIELVLMVRLTRLVPDTTFHQYAEAGAPLAEIARSEVTHAGKRYTFELAVRGDDEATYVGPSYRVESVSEDTSSELDP